MSVIPPREVPQYMLVIFHQSFAEDDYVMTSPPQYYSYTDSVSIKTPFQTIVKHQQSTENSNEPFTQKSFVEPFLTQPDDVYNEKLAPDQITVKKFGEPRETYTVSIMKQTVEKLNIESTPLTIIKK